MNRFICGLLCSFWLTKVNGLGIPDYATFFQDPEASDENAVFDDSTDFWFADADADADAVNKNDDCLSYDGFDHLFSSNVVRLRPRDTCTNPAAAPLSPYTDIYNTNDILNQLSPSPPPSSPDTEKDSNVLDLEHQLNLPSFDPAPKTTTTDNDDICPEEYFGDSRIPVCDIGSFIRNGECPPDSVYFNIYGVRPYSPADPCVPPHALWCCETVIIAHHPLDPPEAAPVLAGFRCLDTSLLAVIKVFNRIPGWTLDQFMQGHNAPGKRLGESSGS